jgi:hypothetical protein
VGAVPFSFIVLVVDHCLFILVFIFVFGKVTYSAVNFLFVLRAVLFWWAAGSYV